MKFDIIIFTHGELAAGFVSALDMILGPGHPVRAMSLNPGEGMAEKSGELLSALDATDAGFKIVLTDMQGATPANAALLAISQRQDAAVITGVNLIMAIQAAELNGEDISPEEALAAIEEAGKTGIRAMTREMFSA